MIRIKKAKENGVSGGVFYLGLAVIGVLAIPAAVLLGLIAGVWTLTDKLTALLSEKTLTFPRDSGILAAGGMNMTGCTVLREAAQAAAADAGAMCCF